MDDMLYADKLAGLISAERYMEKHESFASELKSLERRGILTKLFKNISLKDNAVSVTYTKLSQAIAVNSGQTKEILGYAK
jgi:hypothetical protein